VPQRAGKTFPFLHVEWKEQGKVTDQLSFTYNLSRQLCQGWAWSFLKDTTSSYEIIWDTD